MGDTLTQALLSIVTNSVCEVLEGMILKSAGGSRVEGTMGSF